MKTVGDFKKAGLVFAGGDYCQDRYGDTYNGVWYEHSNIGDKSYDSCNMTKFAWRTNTGEKPSFSGLIEYETCDGIYNSWHTDCVNFSTRIGGKEVIKKWRPSLNQQEQSTPNSQAANPDDKQVFTQDGFTQGGKMKAEMELKAAAFDELMEMAKRDALIGSFKSSVSQPAAALLNCIYESEKASDDITKLVDGETYMFSFWDVGRLSGGLLGVFNMNDGHLYGNGRRYAVGKCTNFVRLIKSPD